MAFVGSCGVEEAVLVDEGANNWFRTREASVTSIGWVLASFGQDEKLVLSWLGPDF